MRKKTIKWAAKDLNNRINHPFFAKGLNRERKVFLRRSFGDIYKHYGKYGFSEKEVLSIMLSIGLTGAICENLKKVVFSKEYKPRPDNVIMSEIYHRFGYTDNESVVVDKYTPTYLVNLLNNENDM